MLSFLCACCVKNISLSKFIKTLVAFLAAFLVCFIYLNCSYFTRWTTALWVSLLVSMIFTVGVISNLYLRVAAVLFFVQIFSQFGLFMTFVSLSWLTLQSGIGCLLHNHRIGYGMRNGKAAGSWEEKDDELLLVENLLGYFHYGVMVPFVCIYIYTILYEITYEGRRYYRKSGRKLSKGKVFITCILLSRNLIMLLVGMIFSATLMVFAIQRLTYRHLLHSLKGNHLETNELLDMSKSWLGFYLCACLVLLVLSPFSKVIMKFRHVIIRSYFNLSAGTIECKDEHRKHVYIVKPKGKRVTFQEVKTEMEEKKKLLKNEADSKSSSNDAETSSEKKDQTVIDLNGGEGKSVRFFKWFSSIKYDLSNGQDTNETKVNSSDPDTSTEKGDHVVINMNDKEESSVNFFKGGDLTGTSSSKGEPSCESSCDVKYGDAGTYKSKQNHAVLNINGNEENSAEFFKRANFTDKNSFTSRPPIVESLHTNSIMADLNTVDNDSKIQSTYAGRVCKNIDNLKENVIKNCNESCMENVYDYGFGSSLKIGETFDDPTSYECMHGSDCECSDESEDPETT